MTGLEGAERIRCGDDGTAVVGYANIVGDDGPDVPMMVAFSSLARPL